jgi:hypothetical protein
MSKAARALVIAGGIILIAYGAVFLVAPQVLGRLVGLEFVRPDAYAEVRAFYGGLELGLGAFLFYGGVRVRHTRSALLLCGFAFAAAGLARAAGVAQYGLTDASQPVVAFLEVAYAAAALLLMRRGLVERD